MTTTIRGVHPCITATSVLLCRCAVELGYPAGSAMALVRAALLPTLESRAKTDDALVESTSARFSPTKAIDGGE